jgi:hypothetical protein
MAPETIWNCQTSRTNCVFHILREVSAETKVSEEHTSALYLSHHALYKLGIEATLHQLEREKRNSLTRR